MIFFAPNHSIAGIGIIKNQGSENFIPSATSSEISGISDLEIVDIDSDGSKDVVYASEGSSVIGWMKNNGSDNFLPAESLATGITAVDQIEIADLDYDNDLDIVSASSETSQRVWLENDGSEGFIPHKLS